MRYLILSDIHANLTALEAVLNSAKGRWKKAVCLGDLVGYGPDPDAVVDAVRKLGAITIRGNHDKAVGDILHADTFNPAAQLALFWTREHLSAKNLKYIEALPPGPLSVDSFSLVHGAFHDEDEYVFAPEQALDGLLSSPTQIAFFGHTHLQGGFALRGETLSVLATRPVSGKTSHDLIIERDAKYLLNPGSVGQPRDDDPRAAFAIADLDQNRVEFWRVPYDIEAVQARMIEANLPQRLIARLAYGH